MNDIRDRVIAEWNDIIDGRVDHDARSVLWRWDDRDLVHLRWLIPQIVDSALRALPPPDIRH